MSRLQRPLTDDEKAELANLNTTVSTALEARRTWLDAKMVECSRLQVGDDIYDLDSGTKLGTVTGMYRFWRDRDEGIRDKSAHFDYEYSTGRCGIDNTSGQLGRSFGTREDALEHAEMRAALLRGGLIQ